MNPGETYDQWHRRLHPDHYLWENYKFPDSVLVDETRECEVPVHIFRCKKCHLIVAGSEMTEDHLKTINYLIAHQDELVTIIREKIFEYYQVVWPDYQRDTDDDPQAPKLGAADILRIDDLVELYSVHCAEKITEGYFGLCLHCTWDGEHDLGIRFRNYQIEVVGGSDVGFHLLPDKK